MNIHFNGKPHTTASATIAALDITAAPANPYEALTLRFTDDAGSWELADASNNLVSSGVFQAGQPVVLPKLSFNFLLALVRAAPRVMTIDDLMTVQDLRGA